MVLPKYDWDKLDNEGELMIPCTKTSEVLKVRTAAITRAVRRDKKVSINQIRDDNGDVCGALVTYV